jgi:hypothetical protein
VRANGQTNVFLCIFIYRRPVGFQHCPVTHQASLETQRRDNNYNYIYVYIYIHTHTYICVCEMRRIQERTYTSSYSYIVLQPHRESVCANGQKTVFLCVVVLYRRPVGFQHCPVTHQASVETHKGGTITITICIYIYDAFKNAPTRARIPTSSRNHTQKVCALMDKQLCSCA